MSKKCGKAAHPLHFYYTKSEQPNAQQKKY